eukprot:28055-Amphidinium_carterae.1
MRTDVELGTIRGGTWELKRRLLLVFCSSSFSAKQENRSGNTRCGCIAASKLDSFCPDPSDRVACCTAVRALLEFERWIACRRLATMLCLPIGGQSP